MRRRPLGATFVEVLISGGLLLTLTTIFFRSVIPLWHKAEWYDQKHGRTRNYIAARERILSLLRPARVLDPAEVTAPHIDSLIHFVRPHEVETDAGTLSIVDNREAVLLDDSRVFEIRLADGLLFATDATESYRQLLWKVGPEATVNVDVSSDRRVIKFIVKGPDWTHLIQARTR